MKKGLTAVVAGCMLALVMASAPAVAAPEMEPLRGEMTLSIYVTQNCPTDPNCYWKGGLSGDVVGTVEFHEFWDQNYVVGGTEHFFETFKITAGEEWISGVDQGVWNLGTPEKPGTFKFRANGCVLAASEGWEDFIGYKLHEVGVTTNLYNDPHLTATATWFLVAP